jgi:hypothetical protein
MLDIFRRGEVPPEGRANEEEVRLIAAGKPARLEQKAAAVRALSQVRPFRFSGALCGVR